MLIHRGGHKPLAVPSLQISNHYNDSFVVPPPQWSTTRNKIKSLRYKIEAKLFIRFELAHDGDRRIITRHSIRSSWFRSPEATWLPTFSFFWNCRAELWRVAECEEWKSYRRSLIRSSSMPHESLMIVKRYKWSHKSKRESDRWKSFL